MFKYAKVSFLLFLLAWPVDFEYDRKFGQKDLWKIGRYYMIGPVLKANPESKENFSILTTKLYSLKEQLIPELALLKSDFENELMYNNKFGLVQNAKEKFAETMQQEQTPETQFDIASMGEETSSLEVMNNAEYSTVMGEIEVLSKQWAKPLYVNLKCGQILHQKINSERNAMDKLTKMFCEQLEKFNIVLGSKLEESMVNISGLALKLYVLKERLFPGLVQMQMKIEQILLRNNKVGVVENAKEKVAEIMLHEQTPETQFVALLIRTKIISEKFKQLRMDTKESLDDVHLTQAYECVISVLKMEDLHKQKCKKLEEAENASQKHHPKRAKRENGVIAVLRSLVSLIAMLLMGCALSIVAFPITAVALAGIFTIMTTIFAFITLLLAAGLSGLAFLCPKSFYKFFGYEKVEKWENMASDGMVYNLNIKKAKSNESERQDDKNGPLATASSSSSISYKMSIIKDGAQEDNGGKP